VVPGDISSAAFFLVAGALVPGARVRVRGVGVNPTRTGILEVLEAMDVRIERQPGPDGPEPTADLGVQTAALGPAEVGGALIPRLIDEIPVLAVAACLARGRTVIRDAAELRVKESDRIRALAGELGRIGARVTETPDGLVIEGVDRLRGAVVDSRGDHRMAMALVVAGLTAEGETVVEDTACIATSFPGFARALSDLAGEPCVVEEP
jgi:3-phosphoshikimate 1-carboxyvinyltransferase